MSSAPPTPVPFPNFVEFPSAADGNSTKFGTVIFAIVLGFGVTRAFLAPASRSLPADIVAADRLAWLVARHSIAWQASIIVGPVLGGVLFDVDPSLPFVAMALMLALASLAVLGIDYDDVVVVDEPLVEAGVEPVLGHDAEPVSGRTTIREAFEGFRFIRRNPVLFGAISLDLFAVLFGGAVALLPRSPRTASAWARSGSGGCAPRAASAPRW